jgi:hypothetical protein
MNHPSREEWMDYLYKEAPPEMRATLTAHLASCPDCKTAVSGWQRTMKSLGIWRVETRRALETGLGSVVKWGIAAVFLVGVGIGFGRLAPPTSAGAASLRAAILPELKQELKREFRGDLEAALLAQRTAFTNEFRQQLQSAVNEASAKVLVASGEATQRLLLDFAATYSDDAEATFALIRKIEQQHRADYADLLKKVETVAVVAEARLQRTQSQIGQLAAFTSPDFQ